MYNRIIRSYRTPDDLWDEAKKISATVYIRTDERYGSVDTPRATTEDEQTMLCRLVYGALLGMNHGEDTRADDNRARAIIDTVEYQADMLFKQFEQDGEQINGYLSIYCPLQRVLKDWTRIDRITGEIVQ